MAVARLTVVMITKDRRNSAVHAVRMLRAMPDDVPVIVVDNASTDGTAEALAGLGALGGVTVIRAATNLGSAGRTVGVEAAASPYVAFADDDSWWAPGALR
jgi:glycosyltransferase involved in cell wall biosynthesis